MPRARQLIKEFIGAFIYRDKDSYLSEAVMIPEPTEFISLTASRKQKEGTGNGVWL